MNNLNPITGGKDIKCALYVRVSTDEQDMANQTMVLRE